MYLLLFWSFCCFVKIKKYKGLGVKAEEVKVEKEEIDQEVEHLLERFAELKTKEGKVEKGNIAIIDFEGFKDGVAFDGGKGENYSLEIGSNTFIPGFEDGVVGMKAGDEKDIELTFPKDYAAKDLAGKKVVFKVKVNEIKQRVIPKYRINRWSNWKRQKNSFRLSQNGIRWRKA